MTILLAILLAAPPPPTPTPTPVPEGKIVLLRQERKATASSPGSLGELARTIRLKLPAGQTTITNENLKALASQSELTMASSSPELASAASGGAESPAGKTRWQEIYQQARGYVAYLESRVTELQELVAGFERRFYAEDDPAYRDGVLKPAWDKALVELRETQAELQDAKGYPDRVIQEARKAGALPGWFRGLPQPQPVSEFEPPWAAAGEPSS